ncbi:MAG: DUF1015 domain-containing protein [Syntrophomonadaceae bacterium]|jgi:uncharacterized protein (DUF1015 family)|nr:DUF1015 domain-containing protein [Syntrophomonadaceae bacterium]
MAVIRPFRALRPIPALVDKVAALPYDVMSSQEAREMVGDNPYSFLHVDKAEIDLDESIDLYDERVYARARSNLDKMVAEGVFIQDQAACLYIYRQKRGQHIQTGLVACLSIDDYLNDVIKKHELTRADKEQDRTRHVDICDAQTGPIFVTYRSQEQIDSIISQWIARQPALYDFVSEDGIGHTVWKIDQEEVINRLQQLFSPIDSLYIADGHHRSASAVQVGLQRRADNPHHTGQEEYNYFLAVLFPDHDPCIMGYNRLVRDLNNHTPQGFIELLKKDFEVEPYSGEGPYQPQAPKSFGMYLEGQWYVLKARPGSYDADDPVARLDVSILQNNILGPILGITNPRTDKRIDFVGGARGLSELEKRVAQDMKIAFAMYPTTIADLMAIADAGRIMPPKSTWFEPKLRSGIFIHKLT